MQKSRLNATTDDATEALHGHPRSAFQPDGSRRARAARAANGATKGPIVRTYHRFSEVDVDKWESVTAGHRDRTLAAPWLRAMEDLAPSARTLYILIEEDGIPQSVGTAVTYRTENPFVNLLLRQCLFFVRPYASTSAFAVRRGASTETAWANIAKVALRLARRGVRPLCAITIDGDALALGNAFFDSRGYALIDAAPSSVIDMRWKNADEWLMSFGRKRRWNIRNAQKIAESAGVVIDVRAPKDVPHDQLLRLLRETCEANGTPDLGGFDVDFMRRLESRFPAKHHVICAYQKGELIGFLWAISDGRSFRTPWAGLRYAVTRETGAYFELLHRAVRLAIEDGVEEFNFGLTNHALKSRYGADVRPRKVAVQLSFLPKVALRPMLPLLQKQFGVSESA